MQRRAPHRLYCLATHFMETPSESARRRLYPSLTDPAYLPLRSRRHIFSSWASDFTGQLLTVLDVGGRYQPYRPLFGTSIRRYFAIDLLKTEFVSVIGNAEHLPFQPASLDLVIATQ